MSNLIEAPSIKIKQTIIENLALQQSCPAPPCTTPLGTPPGPTSVPNNTPPQSPLIDSARLQRIARSNSACIGNNELLPFRYNMKSNSKRRNTQLLQSGDAQDSNSVHYAHRLQSLRTLAAGAQKSNSLVSKGFLRESSKDFKESIDEDEIENETDIGSVLKDVNKTGVLRKDFVDGKLSRNLNQVKLGSEHQADHLNQTDQKNLVSTNTFNPIKETENHIVRRFKSQDIDELIKENKKSTNEHVQDNVQKIMAQAEMRKNQLLLLLDEHQQIVQKIKLAETNK